MTLYEAIDHLNNTLENKTDWSCEECKAEHEQLREWLKELAAYRNLIESKQLVELPFKLGGTVYQIVEGEIIPRYVSWFFVRVPGDLYVHFAPALCVGDTIPVSEFGKTVFPTVEEAEAALEVRSNESD